MEHEDLTAFCKAHQDLSAEALKKEVSMRVEHQRKLVEEDEHRRRRVPMPLSVLRAKGYTDAHLENVAKTCEAEFNPEIQDRVYCNCPLITFINTVIHRIIFIY